jgi:hypothetical protein
LRGTAASLDSFISIIVSLGGHSRRAGSGMLVSTMNSEIQPNDYRHRR